MNESVIFTMVIYIYIDRQFITFAFNSTSVLEFSLIYKFYLHIHKFYIFYINLYINIFVYLYIFGNFIIHLFILLIFGIVILV